MRQKRTSSVIICIYQLFSQNVLCVYFATSDNVLPLPTDTSSYDANGNRKSAVVKPMFDFHFEKLRSFLSSKTPNPPSKQEIGNCKTDFSSSRSCAHSQRQKSPTYPPTQPEAHIFCTNSSANPATHGLSNSHLLTGTQQLSL